MQKLFVFQFCGYNKGAIDGEHMKFSMEIGHKHGNSMKLQGSEFI